MLGNAACDGAIFLGIPCIYDSDGDPVDPGGPSVKAPFFRLNFIINTAVRFFLGVGQAFCLLFVSSQVLLASELTGIWGCRWRPGAARVGASKGTLVLSASLRGSRVRK